MQKFTVEMVKAVQEKYSKGEITHEQIVEELSKLGPDYGLSADETFGLRISDDCSADEEGFIHRNNNDIITIDYDKHVIFSQWVAPKKKETE